MSALDFITQPPDLLSLIGVRTLNLTAGYEWDDLSRSMGGAVLSLRDGSFEEVIWMVDLPAAAAAADATVEPILPPIDGPGTPIVDLYQDVDAEDEGTTDR